MAEDSLRFDPADYKEETFSEDGRTIRVRSYYDIAYCEKPKDGIQKMNLFVPADKNGGYASDGDTAYTPLIFMPNTVGGYLPGPADVPGRERDGRPNTVFCALEHGYTVACVGVRGRTTGKESDEFFEGSKAERTGDATGRTVGRAPAFIVDLKAAIRYLRHNKDVIPGDTDKIVTSGTSAGGALSALAGASGNAEDYAGYLKEIGAADERDDVFAANCYCPIHNLEHADMAYEWLFGREEEFHMMKIKKTEEGLKFEPLDGRMSPEQCQAAKELAAEFPAYLNSLGLKDEKGNVLSLGTDGKGSFQDYVKEWIARSAQQEMDTHEMADNRTARTVGGSEVEKQDFVLTENGKVKDIDWDGYVRAITRMKATPAFDHFDLSSPENEEFGDEESDGRHFTEYSRAHSTADGELADEAVIRMMNPLPYIRDRNADTAKHWRIRHGAYDRDTSAAIPVILQCMLKMEGCDVDFFMPWGVPHNGDYDLDELFAWIDGLCRE